ncbi:MAG TPA: hypothetical protein VIT24_12520 [Acidimicrobiales bacterium]
MTPPDLGDNNRSAPEQLADWVLFAPLGLALEARRLFPEMAARGRRQVLFTRTVGKYALRRGRGRLDGLVGTGLGLVGGFLPGSDGSGSTEATIDTAKTLVAVEDLPPDRGPDSDHLAIPDYDNLSAFQVMPRLEALDPTDLDAVRAYEESTRGRRTILNKIAQLS